MILHSIVSLPDIFCSTDTRLPESRYARIDGGLIELEDGKVKRLISTDPRLYLDPRYFPETRYRL